MTITLKRPSPPLPNDPSIYTKIQCMNLNITIPSLTWLGVFNEGKSIVDNVLWPLLEVHHFGSADLQEVLAYAMTLQVESFWHFSDIAGCFLGVRRELSESKACKLNDAKQEFLHRVRSYDAFAAALLVALTKNPGKIEAMLRGLKDGWMPPQSLDVRCSLCLKLIELLMHRGRSSFLFLNGYDVFWNLPLWYHWPHFCPSR